MWKPQFPLFVDHARLKSIQGRSVAGGTERCRKRGALRVQNPVADAGFLCPVAWVA